MNAALYAVLALAGFSAAAHSGSAALVAFALTASAAAACDLAHWQAERRRAVAVPTGPDGRANPATADNGFLEHLLAVVLFAFGAGVAIDDGFDQLRALIPLTDFPALSVVLMTVTAAAAILALEPRPAARRGERLRGQSVLAGSVMALAGVLASLGADVDPVSDGLAAIAIGCVMATVSALTAIALKRELPGLD